MAYAAAEAGEGGEALAIGGVGAEVFGEGFGEGQVGGGGEGSGNGGCFGGVGVVGVVEG